MLHLRHFLRGLLLLLRPRGGQQRHLHRRVGGILGAASEEGVKLLLGRHVPGYGVALELHGDLLPECLHVRHEVAHAAAETRRDLRREQGTTHWQGGEELADLAVFWLTACEL